ncbi:MAG: DUF3311 domain-containing protein [Gemmatimonadota bacterium]|nr:DUF3311 domain-containing protein [Gemmatimonadota bacterium]MDH5760993.1 DUF3311 domain-containing protein [Gemmatimonadota bacterium]
MTLRRARTLTGIYFTAMTVAVMWPGMVSVARIEPYVLGLPFGFFWNGAWIAVAVGVLYGLDRVERRYRTPSAPDSMGGGDGDAT